MRSIGSFSPLYKHMILRYWGWVEVWHNIARQDEYVVWGSLWFSNLALWLSNTRLNLDHIWKVNTNQIIYWAILWGSLALKTLVKQTLGLPIQARAIGLPNVILYVFIRQLHPSFSLGCGVDHYKVGMGAYHEACVTIEHPKGLAILMMFGIRTFMMSHI